MMKQALEVLATFILEHPLSVTGLFLSAILLGQMIAKALHWEDLRFERTPITWITLSVFAFVCAIIGYEDKAYPLAGKITFAFFFVMDAVFTYMVCNSVVEERKPGTLRAWLQTWGSALKSEELFYRAIGIKIAITVGRPFRKPARQVIQAELDSVETRRHIEVNIDPELLELSDGGHVAPAITPTHHKLSQQDRKKTQEIVS